MRLAAVALVVAACSPSGPSPPASEAAPTAALPRTESGAAAMRALDGWVAGYGARAARDVGASGPAIQARLDRAQITGQLDDYLAADALSRRWVEAAPASIAAQLARARVCLTLHRFADAGAAIEAAMAAGASAYDVEGLRGDLADATGRRDEALAIRTRIASAFPNLASLTTRALTLAELDRTAEALALMPEALATYRDLSAAPLAWFLFQWGRLAEEAGDRVQARALYRLAHERLPRHGEALRHLAALVAADEARRLLEVGVATDPHPETIAMLADLAARRGDPRAAALREQARALWERHVAALPEALAEHAARFYLGTGADAARGLALAERNLASRATPEARALVIELALAAGRPGRACDVAADLGGATRRLRFAAARAFASCGRQAAADRLLRELAPR